MKTKSINLAPMETASFFLLTEAGKRYSEQRDKWYIENVVFAPKKNTSLPTGILKFYNRTFIFSLKILFLIRLQLPKL